MDEGLCKVEPDPIFFYPIPDSTFPEKALFKITCTASHKIRYKIRYGNKHPKMIVQISEESEGTLHPGRCLGIELSLMPGYDVMEHKADSFKIMVWAIPEFLVKNYKLGPKWYKEASAEDMDHHTLDCLIMQQANKDGKMPAISTKPTSHPDVCGDGQWLMSPDGVIYRAKDKMRLIDVNSNINDPTPSSKPNIGPSTAKKIPISKIFDKPEEEPPEGPFVPTKTPLRRPSRIDQMRQERHRAQIRQQLDKQAKAISDQNKNQRMVISDQDHKRITHEPSEYMKLARRKCSDWREKSKEFFQTHPEYEEDEAFMNQVSNEIEDDSVSGLSEAHRARDSSPVSIPKESKNILKEAKKSKESEESKNVPSVKECIHGNASAQGARAPEDEDIALIMETLDTRIMDMELTNQKTLRLLRDFIPN